MPVLVMTVKPVTICKVYHPSW